MKKHIYISLFTIMWLMAFTAGAQQQDEQSENRGTEHFGVNDASSPCFTREQYSAIEQRCDANRRALGISAAEQKNTNSILLGWPLRAASGFTDCSYYVVSAYVDQNTASGVYNDYNCGSNTYDGHHGTDIATWPFHFYKMDHDQVEVVAAAAGTIIDKADGNFDKNCATTSLLPNYIVIQHADGSQIIYGHMKKNSLTTKIVGQTVTAGEYLGVVGSSGNSSGPHLHFEVWSGSTSSTYIDPYYGSCNTLNTASWWALQKQYTEPAIVKASVHTTDALFPACPATETPNESSTYAIPFQGQGLPANAAKFYIFMRNLSSGDVVDLSILDPGGSTFNAWTFTCSANYSVSYWSWTKYLPATPGTYTFMSVYNGVSCSQTFDITTAAGIATIAEPGTIYVAGNPVHDILTLKGSDLENGLVVFTLYDHLGQVIRCAHVTVGTSVLDYSMDVSDLAAGMYYMNVSSQGHQAMIKLMKN